MFLMIVRCIVFFMFSSYVVIWNKDKIARTRRCVLFAEKKLKLLHRQAYKFGKRVITLFVRLEKLTGQNLSQQC